MAGRHRLHSRLAHRAWREKLPGQAARATRRNHCFLCVDRCRECGGGRQRSARWSTGSRDTDTQPSGQRLAARRAIKDTLASNIRFGTPGRDTGKECRRCSRGQRIAYNPSTWRHNLDKVLVERSALRATSRTCLAGSVCQWQGPLRKRLSQQQARQSTASWR